jgi:hypothetical protein
MAPVGASAKTPPAAIAATTQQERDAQARAAVIDKANNAEGEITIQTTRAFHFQHPGSSASVVVKPNTPTVVPAWVQHSDTWALATKEDKLEGYPAQIQLLKDAKPGNVEIVSDNAGTDAPKTPAQIAREQEAIDATHDFYRQGAGNPLLSEDFHNETSGSGGFRRAVPRDVTDERTDEQRKAEADEQAERVKQQQLASQGKQPDPTKAALDKGAEAQKSGDAAQTAQK